MKLIHVQAHKNISYQTLHMRTLGDKQCAPSHFYPFEIPEEGLIIEYRGECKTPKTRRGLWREEAVPMTFTYALIRIQQCGRVEAVLHDRRYIDRSDMARPTRVIRGDLGEIDPERHYEFNDLLKGKLIAEHYDYADSLDMEDIFNKHFSRLSEKQIGEYIGIIGDERRGEPWRIRLRGGEAGEFGGWSTCLWEDNEWTSIPRMGEDGGFTFEVYGDSFSFFIDSSGCEDCGSDEMLVARLHKDMTFEAVHADHTQCVVDCSCDDWDMDVMVYDGGIDDINNVVYEIWSKSESLCDKDLVVERKDLDVEDIFEEHFGTLDKKPVKYIWRKAR